MENLSSRPGDFNRYVAFEVLLGIQMQISLKEILLVIVIIAIAIPFYLSAKSNQELRVENQTLRDKTSSITEIEGMVNVIAIPSASSFTQSWRVLIPKGSNHVYKLAFAQSNISTGGASSFPDLDDSEKFTAAFPGISNLGEFVLSVELDENAPRIYWRIHGLTESRFEFESKNAGWVKSDESGVHNAPRGAVNVNGIGFTASAPPGEPLRLLTAEGRQAPDGVVVFIESQPVHD